MGPVVQIEEGKEGTDQAKEGALTKEQLAQIYKDEITVTGLKSTNECKDKENKLSPQEGRSFCSSSGSNRESLTSHHPRNQFLFH